MANTIHSQIKTELKSRPLLLKNLVKRLKRNGFRFADRYSTVAALSDLMPRETVLFKEVTGDVFTASDLEF